MHSLLFCFLSLGLKRARTVLLIAETPHLEALLGSKELTEQDKVQYGDLMKANEEMMKAMRKMGYKFYLDGRIYKDNK